MGAVKSSALKEWSVWMCLPLELVLSVEHVLRDTLEMG